MRNCGYAFERNVGKEQSFVRRITGQNFPRYHTYVRQSGADLEINLHIDQKKPSYGAGHAHGGDYEGELVERELERIKSFVQ
ncbi:MAG: hypothetical protein ABH822_02180 [Patescibacteria group bacterium]